MKKMKHIATVCVLGLLAGASPHLPAESDATRGTGGSDVSAVARLKLRIVIPRFLYFRVGAVGSSVEAVAFEPATDSVGDGISVAGTAGGSATRVALRSNAGEITIVADNDGGTGGLGNGGPISLSEITARSDSAALQTPQLTDSGGTTIKATPTGGDITDRRAIWSYAYRNRNAVEPGTYSAEIVYTAVSP
jgi:hypothetical protein